MPQAMRTQIVIIALITVAPGSLVESSHAQVTTKQRERVERLVEQARQAGAAYRDGRLVESVELIKGVQTEFLELMESGDFSLHRLARPLYGRLSRAHGLLELEGAELDPLPSWRDLISDAPNSSEEKTDVDGEQIIDRSDEASISFARQIAPMLVENCNGCHLGGRRASGGLRMDSFAQLMRGGDSGPIVDAGDSAESLLVQKVKGEVGQRMPAGGRPPLSADHIRLISVWIDEGATYDGSSPETPIRSVVEVTWADNASHKELFERRRLHALAKWRRVLPNDQPTMAQSEELFVMAKGQQGEVDRVLARFEQAIGEVKERLAAPRDQPLIKGGMSLFVLGGRYDYSEFGRMLENRELPGSWLGHWQADPLEVYGVVMGESHMEATQADSVALQLVAGAHLGGYPKVPFWFAEGVARNLVVEKYRGDDPRIEQWRTGLPQSTRQLEGAKQLMDGRVDEETAGLVGIAITNTLMNRSNRRRLDRLLDLLREGQPFPEALAASFAPPQALIKNWLGK